MKTKILKRQGDKATVQLVIRGIAMTFDVDLEPDVKHLPPAIEDVISVCHNDPRLLMPSYWGLIDIINRQLAEFN